MREGKAPIGGELWDALCEEHWARNPHADEQDHPECCDTCALLCATEPGAFVRIPDALVGAEWLGCGCSTDNIGSILTLCFKHAEERTEAGAFFDRHAEEDLPTVYLHREDGTGDMSVVESKYFVTAVKRLARARDLLGRAIDWPEVLRGEKIEDF